MRGVALHLPASGANWLRRSVGRTPLVRTPADQLEPYRDLVRGPADSEWEWEATGGDPQFRLGKHLPLPGWHMLELTMEHDQPCVTVKLFLDTGAGFSEEESVEFPIRGGRVNKRLFYVPRPLRALRIDPMDVPGRFSLSHLRIVWVTPWLAHRRLARRLRERHPEWRDLDERAVRLGLRGKARARGRKWRAEALEEYANTFAWRPAAESYAKWVAAHSEETRAAAERGLPELAYRPCLSILLPTWNPPAWALRACLDSVLAQSYANWQLCVADDASSDPEVRAILTEYAEADQRIHVDFRQENGHVCAAGNSALALAHGEFVALLDHDDRLEPNALFHVVEALNRRPDTGLLYSDEDKITPDGERYDPHLKPQWNPDLLLSQNYVAHLCVLRTGLVREVGGFREGVEGSQDHDLVLRCSARLRTDQIVHVPRVLYHWRASAGSTALHSDQKSYTESAGLRAVRDYLSDVGSQAAVQPGELPNTYRVRWPLPDPPPRVSLLVPTRDRVEVLRPCIDAILERTEYPDFEVLILDNDSECRETLQYMQSLSEDPRVRVLRWDRAFNYSAINNFGARHATGDVLALVNNDVEPTHPEWLDELVRQAARPEIGCVGAKLYYANDTIQHAGVILGIGGVAGHAHRFFRSEEHGYFSRLRIVHNVSAVTGACLVVRKSVFDEVGGLDERNLPVAFNDVDFCLRVREAGYRNLFTPYAELYHYESVSRKGDDTPAKRARADREVRFMRERWGELLDRDPAYNPNLSLTHEDFSLG